MFNLAKKNYGFTTDLFSFFSALTVINQTVIFWFIISGCHDNQTIKLLGFLFCFTIYWRSEILKSLSHPPPCPRPLGLRGIKIGLQAHYNSYILLPFLFYVVNCNILSGVITILLIFFLLISIDSWLMADNACFALTKIIIMLWNPTSIWFEVSKFPMVLKYQTWDVVSYIMSDGEPSIN